MEHQITSEDQLRALMGEPIHPLVVAKSTPVLTPAITRYIELSPFAAWQRMLPTGQAISAREVILQAGSISKTTKL